MQHCRMMTWMAMVGLVAAACSPEPKGVVGSWEAVEGWDDDDGYALPYSNARGAESAQLELYENGAAHLVRELWYEAGGEVVDHGGTHEGTWQRGRREVEVRLPGYAPRDAPVECYFYRDDALLECSQDDGVSGHVFERVASRWSL